MNDKANGQGIQTQGNQMIVGAVIILVPNADKSTNVSAIVPPNMMHSEIIDGMVDVLSALADTVRHAEQVALREAAGRPLPPPTPIKQ
jgi:uncharacterized MnhB-related membrane protein